MSDWESDGERSAPSGPWQPPSADDQRESRSGNRGRGGRRGRGDGFQDRGRGRGGGRGEGRGGRGEGRGGRGDGRGGRGGDRGSGRRGSGEGRVSRGRGSRGARQGGRDGSLDRDSSRSPEVFGSYQGGYTEGRAYGPADGRGSRGTSRGFRIRGTSSGRGTTRGRGAMNGMTDKPPEKYIPPELPDDENAMFSSGIQSGANFDSYDFIEVKVTGENPPEAIKCFSDAGLEPLLLENVTKSGYSRPTPIQKTAIPIILARRDVMACAQTGSGKTAAFLIPVIQRLLTDEVEPSGKDCCEPQAVIVSPTRELAIQIFQEARKFALQSQITAEIAYGGVVESHQLQKIQKGCHILVATPGRLNSFVTKGKIGFSKLKFFILDEADRMLDMGFLPEVEKMLHHSSMDSSTDRTTLMFSATFPAEIQQLAGKYLKDYLFVTVGIVGSACADVEQKFQQVAKFQKNETLLEVLKERKGSSELTLVFVSQKRIADFIAVLLCENDIRTTSIHGDRYQSQREQALDDFKSGRMPTLIATGVAARGLDIKNVGHVINFDLPPTIDEYVHRIGRTGRLGNTGRATSFYDSSEDIKLAKPLVTILEQAGQEIPDFLLKDAESSFTASDPADFNGADIRPGQDERTTAMPQEEEEDW